MPVKQRSSPALVFRAGEYACALGISDVVEILRPQPVQKLEQMPAGLSGLSLIRGSAVPVCNLSELLGGGPGVARRLVFIRAGSRRVALAVDAVIGVRDLQSLCVESAPSLMGDAGEALEGIARLDRELLLVLRSAKILSSHTWQQTPQP